MKSADSQPLLLSFEEQVSVKLGKGWEVVSDGPTGIQMREPKKMRSLDKACMVFGVLTVIVYGVGLFFILIALIDYVALTPRKTVFIPRNQVYPV